MLTTIKNVLPSFIRTVVPAVVAWLLSIPLVTRIFDWFGVSADDRNAWTARAVTFVIFALYYLLARILEEHQSAFGWLLGLAKAPAYATKTDDGAHIVTTLNGGNAEDALDELAPDNAEHPDQGDSELQSIFFVLGALAFLVFIANVAYVRFSG